jgi:hypothetical protein
VPTSQPSLSIARPDPSAWAPDRLPVGDKVSRRTLQTLAGPLPFPYGDGLTHLELRRFAGCPVCNLHLRAFVLRSDEVIVFHSSAAEVERYQPDLPFPIVPDPDRELYRAFGAERSISAVLSPRLWRHVPRILLGVISRQWTVDELLAYTRAARAHAAGEGGVALSHANNQPPVRAAQTSQGHR